MLVKTASREFVPSVAPVAGWPATTVCGPGGGGPGGGGPGGGDDPNAGSGPGGGSDPPVCRSVTYCTRRVATGSSEAGTDGLTCVAWATEQVCG